MFACKICFVVCSNAVFSTTFCNNTSFDCVYRKAIDSIITNTNSRSLLTFTHLTNCDRTSFIVHIQVSIKMEIRRAHLWYEVNRFHENRMREFFIQPGYRDVRYKLLLSPADVSHGGVRAVLIFRPI